MSLSQAKVNLTKRLLETDNEALIKHLTAIIDSYETDIWDELSSYQKKVVNESQKQLKDGRGVPHGKVRKQYAKWLTK